LLCISGFNYLNSSLRGVIGIAALTVLGDLLFGIDFYFRELLYSPLADEQALILMKSNKFLFLYYTLL